MNNMKQMMSNTSSIAPGEFDTININKKIDLTRDNYKLSYATSEDRASSKSTAVIEV